MRYDELDYFRGTIGSRLVSRLSEGIQAAGSKLTLYTSSKDSDLYKHFLSGDLRFGDNAGLMYGFGTYTLMEPPEETSMNYKADTRSGLYGDNLYEFEIDDARIFFLLWDDYKTMPRAKSSTPNTFIADQFKKLTGKVPKPEVLEAIGAPLGKNNSNSQAATAFFRYCNSAYYQNQDGTLNSPINGFVYRGANDGHTCVVWNPYAMKPLRVRDASGEWSPIDLSDEEEYAELAELMGKDGGMTEERRFSNEDRIFGGIKTETKEAAYRHLMNYGKDSRAFLGNFKNVVIENDGGIYAKYQSNLPQLDGGHYFRVMKSPELEAIEELGFHLAELDCGIKFGSESSSDCPDFDAPRCLLPDRVTGGLILVNECVNFSLDECPVELGKREIKLVKCEVVTTDGWGDWKVMLDPNKPSWADESVKNELLEQGFDWADDLLTEKPADKKSGKKKESSEDLFDRVLREAKIPIFWYDETIEIGSGAKTKDAPASMIYDELLDDLGYSTVEWIGEGGKAEYEKFKAKFGGKPDAILLINKQSGKSKYMNVHLDCWPTFINKLKNHSQCELKLLPSGEPAVDNANSIEVTYDRDGSNQCKLKIRFSHGSVGSGNAGEIYEKWLFKLLSQGANLSNRLYRSDRDNITPAEQELIKDIKRLHKNEDFNANAIDTFDALDDILLKTYGKPYKISRQKIGVYLTTKNSSASATLYTMMLGWVKETNETIKALGGTNKISINLMEKADIVISLNAAGKGTIYIPISVKLSEDGGNNGERGAKFFTDLSGIKGNPDLVLSRQCALFKTNPQSASKYFSAVMKDYIGDVGMIYAYSNSSVIDENTSTVFKFKTPKRISVTRASYVTVPVPSLVIECNGEQVKFARSHANKWTLKMKTSLSKFFTESTIKISGKGSKKPRG